MSAPSGTRRLVYLRNELFRYIKSSAQPHYGPGYYVEWASCHKPEKPIYLQVTNPGTSFARVAVATPKFATTMLTFSQPCKAQE